MQRASPFNPRIADLGLRSFLQMVLTDNLIHADLHPGNINVRVGAEATGALASWLCPLLSAVSGVDLAPRCAPVELSLLDVGMTTQLRAEHQRALVALYQGIARLDGGAIAESILELRHRESTARCDVDAFRADMRAMFATMTLERFRSETQARDGRGWLHPRWAAVADSACAQEIMGGVMESLRRARITMDAGPSTVLITTFVLEGWSSKLNPDIRILDAICDILPQTWTERIPRTVDRVVADGSLELS